jgi:hypothetical protein
MGNEMDLDFEKIGVLNEVKSAAPPMQSPWSYIDGPALSNPVEAPEEPLRFFPGDRGITSPWIGSSSSASSANQTSKSGWLLLTIN